MLSSVLLFASLICASVASPTESSSSTQGYIVKLKPQRQQFNVISTLLEQNSVSHKNNKVRQRYNPEFFNGFAGDFDEESLRDLKNHDDVEYVEKDAKVTMYDSQKSTSWGLTRVSERKLDLKQAFKYPKTAGEGVTAYVIDTGIFEHRDFGGRASTVVDFTNGTKTDENGHGTHCSGTIGSKTYGIAKQVTLKGVRVLDAEGSGSISGVISGIQYVADQASKVKSNCVKTLASMSLGGGASQAIVDAVEALVKAGVVVVVAAGNDGADACENSPANAPSAVAVGATDKTDSLADFSNVGKCVKILAPGVDIKSTWNNGKTNTISGTSMAAPHVSGVTATLLSQQCFPNPAAVAKQLVSTATPDSIKGVDSSTPNLMVYNGGEGKQ